MPDNELILRMVPPYGGEIGERDPTIEELIAALMARPEEWHYLVTWDSDSTQPNMPEVVMRPGPAEPLPRRSP